MQRKRYYTAANAVEIIILSPYRHRRIKLGFLIIQIYEEKNRHSYVLDFQASLLF